MKSKRIVFGFIILLVLAIVATMIWQFTRKKTNVSLTLAPSIAQAVVDGSINVKQGDFYLVPGQHKLLVKMDGFADRALDFSVKSGQVSDLTIVLIPNSPVGVSWLQNHRDEELRREGLGGEKFDSTTSSAVKNLPLLKDLPFIDQLYRIDYGKSQKNPNDPNALAIYIEYYSDTGKQQALDWLRFKGYDPTKLELIYQKVGP